MIRRGSQSYSKKIGILTDEDDLSPVEITAIKIYPSVKKALKVTQKKGNTHTDEDDLSPLAVESTAIKIYSSARRFSKSLQEERNTHRSRVV